MDQSKILTELRAAVEKAFDEAVAQFNGHAVPYVAPPDAPTRVAMFLTLIQRGVLTHGNYLPVAKGCFDYQKRPSFEHKGWVAWSKDGQALLTAKGNAEYLRRYGILTPHWIRAVNQIALVYGASAK